MSTEIKIDDREGLIAHIEGLQAVLTKRNAVIADLQEKLELAVNGEPTQKALKDAYRNGWRACAANFGDVARKAEDALRMVSTIGRQVHVDGFAHGVPGD